MLACAFKHPLTAYSLMIVGCAAVVIGIVSYPFVFDAFGRHDNPFDKPTELLWILLFTAGAAPVLLALVYVRRAFLILSNR